MIVADMSCRSRPVNCVRMCLSDFLPGCSGKFGEILPGFGRVLNVFGQK